MVDETSFESISVDIDGGVATITFNRPEVYNAINDTIMGDLNRAFDEIQLDRSIDVVVLTGEGDDAFSAGADITEYAGPPEAHDHQKDRQELFAEMYRKPFECHAPVIARINGYCVGGGLILAMFCDLRIAVVDAQFGLPVTDIGQVPTGNSTWRAVELVGEGKTKELVYTAGMIDAEEAHRIGLINRVVPRGELDDVTTEIVSAIQDTGRRAVKNSKVAINHAVRSTDPDAHRAFEAEVWWSQFATEERRRLVDDFIDR